MIPGLRFGSALSFFRSTVSSHTLRPGLAQLRRRLVFARSGEWLGAVEVPMSRWWGRVGIEDHSLLAYFYFAVP